MDLKGLAYWGDGAPLSPADVKGTLGLDYWADGAPLAVATPLLVTTQEISPSSIGSGEAIGTAKIGLNLLVSSTASPEAMGSLTVSPGAVTVAPSSIISQEVVGRPVFLGAQLLPSSISTAEAFGTPALALNVQPSSVSPGEAFGTPALGIWIIVSAIPSEITTGTPTVSPGAVEIAPAAITSQEVFGILALSLQIKPDASASDEAVGTPEIIPGAVTLAPTGVKSAAHAVPAIYYMPGWDQTDIQDEIPQEVLDAQDAAVVAALSIHYQVTVGQHYSHFDGSVDLGDYDAVLILASVFFGVKMPDAGQIALNSFVQSGGGLITGEWVLYGDYYSQHPGNIDWPPNMWGGLSSVFPAEAGGEWVYDSPGTYTQNIANRRLNKGLPSSFSFPVTDFDGTESVIFAKEGADTFYASTTTGASGLVGWNCGSGRVLQFSSCLGPDELSDPNFKQLFLNTVAWVANLPEIVVGAVDVAPNAIASGETPGTPLIVLFALPSGIASAEAFGSPQLNLVVNPSSVDYEEEVGEPVMGGWVRIDGGGGSHTGIVSAEAFGSPQLNLILLPSAIASDENIGTLAAIPGPVWIRPFGIESAEARGFLWAIAPKELMNLIVLEDSSISLWFDDGQDEVVLYDDIPLRMVVNG
jgi:hypothetical protein